MQTAQKEFVLEQAMLVKMSDCVALYHTLNSFEKASINRGTPADGRCKLIHLAGCFFNQRQC